MKQPVEIFYDGKCVVCSLEMDRYRRHKHADRLKFVDISSPQFKAQDFGLDPKDVQKVMHARNKDGELKTKVDAFIAIWEVLPGYEFAAKLAKKPWIRPFLDVGYEGFAKIRPFLPRKKGADCDTGHCEIK
jgi:predicted DCC family thiol-disulfide oxidoreductase YuxK